MAEEENPSEPSSDGTQRRKNSPLGVGILLVILLFLLMSNVWFTREGVIAELKEERPKVTKVYSIERNYIRLSRVSAEEDGRSVEICLDSDIFFKYEFVDCPQYDPSMDYSF